MAQITFEDVSKVFPDGTRAVDGLDLEIADGEFTILVGPSGSGKSTALRMVAGLEDASSGAISIGDRVVNDVPPKDRDIAMVFQSYALYPHMSVEDNLGFALKMQGVRERGNRVRSVAGRLGIREQLARRPRQLSGGQRQRVALGRAIVREPAAFLMDEPLSNLDAKLRVEMRAYIARLHQELGTTTLYVTHDQTEAMTMGDRVAVMRDGRLEQVDAPQALYDRPANLFVAGFVGSPPIGLLPARLAVSAGSAGFRVGARTLPLWAPVPAELSGSVDRDVVLGVRPEDVHDAGHGADPDLVALPATVLSVEHTGPEKIVTVEVAAPPVTAPGAERAEPGATGARLRARFPPDSTVRPGTSVQVAVDAAAAHVFDAATGNALYHPDPAVRAG
jgi:multiple sugar transport system ATP-binding protein